MAQPAPIPPSSAPPEPVSEHKPFVAPETVMPELTLLPVVVGSLLGVVFAASSVYLGLKVGLTVSASIPVAVLSITLFRWFSRTFGIRSATVLENNIVQTTGSAGESLAAGVAFTLPSLLLMGHDLELLRILLVALLGGLIGVLMMIPLRHGLIVKEHGKLMYPEGTACADVLIVGEKGGTDASTVFLGFFVGLVYSFFNLIANLWQDTATFAVSFWGKLKGATLAFEVSPAMLGVGYIIGPAVAANMMAGGALAFLIMVPLIHLFGDGMASPMYPETHKLISQMSPGELRTSYILYIGAGAVATGGFIALARAIPTILSAFKGGIQDLKAGAAAVAAKKRTERDLPMTVVVGGSLALAVAIWLAPVLQINVVSAFLIVLFGFFFVTVSSRITGEIGSSSNPISGMTVATLLITCGLFVLVGWTGVAFKAMALSTAALVCVAASNGGTISQDLKTGYLVGSTPRHQQVSILIGVISSAIAIGFVMLLLDQAHTTYRPESFPGFSAASLVAPDAKKVTAPDGKEYRVAYVQEDTGPLERGRYLVDGDGSVAYTMVSSVDRRYPWRLQQAPAAESGVTLPIEERRDYPDVTLAVPADAPRMKGLDGNEYAEVTLAAANGSVPAGRYLVSDKGKVAYALDVPPELGLDHKPYHPVTLERAIGAAPVGRYLVDDAGKVVYEAKENWKFDAPKAQLFRLIIDGTLGGKLPWGLVLVGMFLAIMMELVGVSSLPFAVGVYLPISTSAGIFVGGIVRWLVDRKRKAAGETAAEAEFSPGMLMASGLIAGGAILGVVQSALIFGADKSPALKVVSDKLDLSWLAGSLGSGEGFGPNAFAMLFFLAMAGWLYWVGVKPRGKAA